MENVADSGRTSSASDASAYEVVRTTLAELGEEPELDQFLGRVLKNIVDNLGAIGADLWIYDEPRGAIHFQSGLIRGEVTTDPPSINSHSFRKKYDFWAVNTEEILRGGWRFESDFLDIVAKMDHEALAWYQAMGVAAALRVPVTMGRTVIGNIAIWKGDCCPFAAGQVEVAVALAQQAALCIHIARTAQLAFVREREHAVLNERARMSEEMHDGIQQVFTAILLQLATANRYLSLGAQPPSAEVVDALSQVRDLAENGIHDVRHSIAALRSHRAEQPRLLSGMLHDLCRSVHTDALECRLDWNGLDSALTEDQISNLFRICQEAVSNVCKHSLASHLVIKLTCKSDEAQLEIVDNGRGFSTRNAQNQTRGLGLRTMKSRAERIGAELAIKSRLGVGTTIFLRMT